MLFLLLKGEFSVTFWIMHGVQMNLVSLPLWCFECPYCFSPYCIFSFSVFFCFQALVCFSCLLWAYWNTLVPWCGNVSSTYFLNLLHSRLTSCSLQEMSPAIFLWLPLNNLSKYSLHLSLISLSLSKILWFLSVTHLFSFSYVIDFSFTFPLVFVFWFTS